LLVLQLLLLLLLGLLLLTLLLILFDKLLLLRLSRKLEFLHGPMMVRHKVIPFHRTSR